MRQKGCTAKESMNGGGIGPQKVIEAACAAFDVPTGELGRQRGQRTKENVKHARMACGLLARPAGVTLVGMAREMDYPSERYLLQLRRKGRTWLRWAGREEPPPQPGLLRFRAGFERVCRAVGVNSDEVA